MGEALESRNDPDEALDKICHLARRETRWTFESNLNLTSIINLTKNHMRFLQATNTFSSIHSYIFFVGGRDLWLTHLFRMD